MVGSRLPEPVLCLALDAVEKIQGGEETVIALWSVFSRVNDAVENGRRLENMSWRLWHYARVIPRAQLSHKFPSGLPPFPEMRPRPLSSPAHSFTSSSEGTATSSDWDHDTAVGEDDDVQQALHSLGARRNTVVSPRFKKTHLNLSSGTTPAETPTIHTPPPAPSSHRSHGHDSSYGDPVHVREFPSAQSDFTPQGARSDVPHERGQGVSLSVSLHHGANLTPRVSGDGTPSSPYASKSPHTLAQDLKSLATLTIGRSIPSASTHPIFAPDVLTATVTSSSMPIILPSLAGSRKDTISVGRIIADLFPQKKMGDTVRNMVPEGSVHIQRAFGIDEGRGPAPASAERAALPKIIEPQPSMPAADNTPALLGHAPSSSASATTSATTTPRQAFPTVVVVNPTPHPTPPATPTPGASDPTFGLKPTANTFDRLDIKPKLWGETANGQLVTPVSLNGDSGSFSPVEPIFQMVEPKVRRRSDVIGPYRPIAQPQPVKELQSSNTSIGAPPIPPSLPPAAAITLPERPGDICASHLPTPSSNPHSEMSNSSKSTSTAPIPAPEDKKFFLAALHSSSGHESSESPDSLGGASISPQKVPQMSKDGMLPLQAALAREDEVASSFSAGSPGGRPHSAMSSRAGPGRYKGRIGYSVASGSRRRQGPKKAVMAVKQSARMEAEIEVKEMEKAELNAQEEPRPRSKGKERAVDERAEPPNPGPSTSADDTPVKAQQQKLQRSHASPQPPQNLRQLPTNPPRQQAHPAASRPAADASARPSTDQHPNTRHLPFHPQLGHLGLGHLPTVPPRPRRPIEITETSTEYETTDTDESSWESESISGEEAGEGEGRSRSTRAIGPRQSRTAGRSTASRTRDAGEFQRDAEREAQRARELFQKLPPRSYSHLGQLPRAKSGLSQLFQPDPELFPEGHPYRTSHSSRDLLARNWSAPGMPLAMTAIARSGAAARPAQAAVTVQPVIANPTQESEGSGAQRQNGSYRSGYRRRGPPQDQVQETDSGEDDPEDTIQVSSSVAQRRLEAIIGQRPAKQPQPQRPTASRTNSHPEVQVQPATSQPVSRTTTAPVLMHPFLPDPAPLQTPHTVRRNIIKQELDEELRRNLLWERSQNQIQGRPPRAPGSILPGPWRPLTTMRPEESRETQSTSDRGPGQRSFLTQRTKSWAGEYHASGW